MGRSGGVQTVIINDTVFCNYAGSSLDADASYLARQRCYALVLAILAMLPHLLERPSETTLARLASLI
jgi:hypothetical protein